MSEPFIGQIRIFAGNFAPRSYAFCDGQLISIAQNEALFALLGTTYGGDGRTTFGLPDLRGRAPIHMGQGPGLSDRRLGEKGGAETETINASTMPNHSHALQASADLGNSFLPNGRVLAKAQRPPGNMAVNAFAAPAGLVAMDGLSLEPEGGTPSGAQPHNNMQPSLAVNFIIALQGIFPPRN